MSPTIDLPPETSEHETIELVDLQLADDEVIIYDADTETEWVMSDTAISRQRLA